jgi:hypothetical protein
MEAEGGERVRGVESALSRLQEAARSCEVRYSGTLWILFTYISVHIDVNVNVKVKMMTHCYMNWYTEYYLLRWTTLQPDGSGFGIHFGRSPQALTILVFNLVDELLAKVRNAPP